MTDHSMMKLGKRAPVYNSKTPRLANYLGVNLPAPPLSLDFSTKLQDLGMMLNDKLGDCTCAAVGHAIQTWTSQTRDEQAIIPDSEILSLYENSCGYNPDDPTTDQGGVEEEVLRYWRNSGIFPGNTLAGWCTVQPGNHQQVRQALMLFGVVYIGLDLPISCQSQDVWDVPAGGAVGPGAPGSWGGHAVPVVAYDFTTLTVITWGSLKKLTWQFWDAYCDEAHGLLSADWIENGHTPDGFYWTKLKADLLSLAQ